MLVRRKKSKLFLQEKQFVELMHEKIRFLLISMEEMTEAISVLTTVEI